MKRDNLKQTAIGYIPQDWDIDSISNLATITTGDKNTQDKVTSGKFPFFVRSQTVERINTYSYNGEAVLTAGDGVGTGKVFHYIDGKFDYHQRVYKISDFGPRILGYYFFMYFSKNFYDRIMSMTAKSSVDSVRMEMIADMLIPLPSLEEQKAIAAALSDVDQLIVALDKLIAKKQDIKTAVMQQLLTGKIRLPGFDKGKGYKRTEIGLVPKDWDVRSLGTIGSFRKGRNIPKKELTPRGKPCVLYGEIYTKYDAIVKRLTSFIPEKVAKIATPIHHGDILFAGSGETAEEIGKCFAYLGKETAYAGGDLIILTLTDGYSAFLGYLLNAPLITKQKATIGQGSSVIHIYASGLATIKIPVPSQDEQTAIATILSDIDAEISALEKRRDKTKAIKQGMMQELLTGRTRLI